MNKKGNFSFTLDSDRALGFLEDFARAMNVFICNHKWFQTQKPLQHIRNFCIFAPH